MLCSCVKHGSCKKGRHDDEMVETAFAFAEWMVQLSITGGPVRQASYTLHSVVIASQLAGSMAYA